MPRTCEYIKPDDQQCRAHAMEDSVYCFAHNPDVQDERMLAVMNGGKAPRRNYKPLPEIILSDNKSVVTLLATTINEVRGGSIELRVANCIDYLAGHLIKALEVAGLEERVAEIERIVLERIKFK